jgi:hypothetical protein
VANDIWQPKQQARAQVGTLTVTTADTGGTITVTVGGTKSVVVTPSTTDTTTTAAEIAAACAASAEGEFAEITWESALAVVTFTGPDDGAPITVAKTDGGTNATTLATTVTPLSPHDINDAANWSLGAVPTGADVAVFEAGDVDALYNLAALTAVAFDVIRRATFTGRIGLPDVDEQFGYREYRDTHLETAGTSIQVQQAPGDDAGQVRIRATAAGATAVTVTGSGASGTPGGEPVEVYGLASTSTVNVANAGVAVGPETDRAATVATVRGVNATVRLGPAVTATTVNLTDCDALILCSYTTLTVDRGGTCEVAGAAVGTTTEIEEGTVLWKSTGTFGTLDVGSDGVMDLAQAPAEVTPTAITLNEGAELNDPAERLARPYDVNLTRTQLDRVTMDLGTHYALTVAAHP